MLIQECWTLSSMTKHQLKELQSAPSSTENSGSTNHAELQEKLVHQNTNTFANCKYLKSFRAINTQYIFILVINI